MVFGLPGNPVSVQVGYKVFVEKYLYKSLNIKNIYLSLTLDEGKNKPTRFDHFFPVKFTDNDRKGLIPVGPKSSGDIIATVNTDGIARHPANKDNLKAGTVVEFFPWK